MPKKKLTVAIVGAGMGGLAVAATLRRVGIDVQVYEQATRFARIGAGIQMMPNSMKVLRGIGVEDRLRATSFAPFSHLNRIADTGEVTRELPMPESLYNAPYLCMHRADLHDALASAVPPEIVHLNKKLVGLDQAGGRVTLRFEDASSATADAVVGPTACIRSCATSWSGRMRRSTKAASPIARYSRQNLWVASISDLRARNGGAPTATSSSITPTRRRAKSILSPACPSRLSG
jgi:hypothetical protein